MQIEEMQPVRMDFDTGLMSGRGVRELRRTVSDLKGVFRDEDARRAMDQASLVYSVYYVAPVEEGNEGGLFWGATVIEPGRVGGEYFMTKGHFHSLRNRGEYYVSLSGEGALILMGGDRQVRMEPMRRGSVHYIPGFTAHRVANTGPDRLSFAACWPSDAGHDYETICEQGFSVRLVAANGTPILVEDV